MLSGSISFGKKTGYGISKLSNEFSDSFDILHVPCLLNEFLCNYYFYYKDTRIQLSDGASHPDFRSIMQFRVKRICYHTQNSNGDFPIAVCRITGWTVALATKALAGSKLFLLSLGAGIFTKLRSSPR